MTTMDRSLARYPIVAVGLTGAAFSAIKTGRDALFFSAAGISELPIAYLLIELGLTAGAWIHLGAMRRFGSRKTRVGVFLFSAVLFLAFVPFVGPGQRTLMRVLFPLVPTIFAALFAAAWLLAGDLLEGQNDLRLTQAYGYVGASAMFGGLAGAFAAKGLAQYLQPQSIIACGSFLLIVCALVCVQGHRANRLQLMTQSQIRDASRTDRQKAIDTFQLLKVPYTRVLLAISAFATVAAMYVEFQFYASAYNSGKGGAHFFADYYIYLSGASLLLQVLVAPRVQTRYGLSRALIVLPIGIFGAAGMVAFTGSIVTQSILRVIENSLKNSIHRSSWEQVFLRFNREQRAAVKVLIDGTVPRIAGIIGALALYGALMFGGERAAIVSATWAAWAIIPIAIAWISVTRLLDFPTTTGAACDIRVPDS